MTMTTRKIRRIINWTTEEDTLISNIILAEIHSGSTLQKAFNIATEKVNNAFGNDRTSDGVNFRWTTILKPDYITEYEKAKAAGKLERAKNRSSSTSKATQQQSLPLNGKEEKDEVTEFINNNPVNNVSQLQMEEKEKTIIPVTTIQMIEKSGPDSVLQNLEVVKSFIENSANMQLQLVTTQTELKFAQNKLQEADEKYLTLEQSSQKKYEALQKQYETLEEDYNAILKLIDRARKLTVNEENEQIQEKKQACKFTMERNGNLVTR